MTEVSCLLTQAESSLSRRASEGGGAESEPSTLTQRVASMSVGQETADSPQAEQVGVKLPFLGFHRAAHDQPPASPPPTAHTIPYKCNITGSHFTKHTVFRCLLYLPLNQWLALISGNFDIL